MDPDFLRNIWVFEEPSISISYREWLDPNLNLTWKLQIIENTQIVSDFSYMILHDNENEAFDVGVLAVKEFGGTLVTLNCNEARRCNGLDPNRVFRSSPEFFDLLVETLGEGKVIYGLHNNMDTDIHDHGVIYAIPPEQSREALRERQRQMGLSSHYNSGDGDDLLLVNGYALTIEEAFPGILDWAKENQVNLMYEINHPDYDDGSFSFMATHNEIDYYNIEAQHGHFEAQWKVLSLLINKMVQTQTL